MLAASSVASNVAGGILGVGGISTATLGLGTTGVIPALAGLGLLGAAGAGAGLMALSECEPPMLCVAASGQCCFSFMNNRGVIDCPQSC